MNYFLIYLILMLDHWVGAFVLICIICSIILLIDIFGWILMHAEDIGSYSSNSEIKSNNTLIKKIFKITFIVFIISFIFAILCPNTKQAATIYLLPKITSNKNMQQLPSKTAQLLLMEVKKEINTINALPSNIEIKKD